MIIDSNPVTTPILEDNLEYQALVGSLIYLSVVTRPDIAYAVSIISQNMK
jgi:hypothetical protein